MRLWCTHKETHSAFKTHHAYDLRTHTVLRWEQYDEFETWLGSRSQTNKQTNLALTPSPFLGFPNVPSQAYSHTWIWHTVPLLSLQSLSYDNWQWLTFLVSMTGLTITRKTGWGKLRACLWGHLQEGLTEKARSTLSWHPIIPWARETDRVKGSEATECFFSAPWTAVMVTALISHVFPWPCCSTQVVWRRAAMNWTLRGPETKEILPTSVIVPGFWSQERQTQLSICRSNPSLPPSVFLLPPPPHRSFMELMNDLGNA